MLRITGGQFRGQRLQSPALLKTRPTQARVREALFHSLGSFLTQAKVLDLFSGSGALGLEALSRGADQVVFVEKSRGAQGCIRKNVEALGLKNQSTFIFASVEAVRSKIGSKGPYDLVLIDPPYERGWGKKLIGSWNWKGLLEPGGRICLEESKRAWHEIEIPPSLVKIREKTYGDTLLVTFEKVEEDVS